METWKLVKSLDPSMIEDFQSSIIWQIIKADMEDRLKEFQEIINALSYHEGGLITGDRESDIARKAAILELRFLLQLPKAILADVKVHIREASVKEAEEKERGQENG